MSGDKKQNLQDTFLNSVRKSKMPLTIFLVNGVKLQGVVTWFDNFCVLLRREGQIQLVYKHAISTIMPSGPVQMFDAEADADEGQRLLSMIAVETPVENALVLHPRFGNDRAADADYDLEEAVGLAEALGCLLYTSPSPRDQRGSRMPSSA